MAQLPERLKFSKWSRKLISAGFELVSVGKVREMYRIPGYPSYLLMLMTDRISIFNFVLNTEVLCKGEVLTLITHFWWNKFMSNVPNHFVPSELNPNWNAVIDLKKKFPCIPAERCLVVQEGDVLPYELIFRGHPGGSIWEEYSEHGTVYGEPLASGIKKWSRVNPVLFTPTHKSEEDEQISPTRFFEQAGEAGRQAHRLTLGSYQSAYSYAESKGIRILDSKFEAGKLLWNGQRQVAIIDEVMTPDSSRYVEESELWAAIEEGRDPQFLDKEFVRIKGRELVYEGPDGPIHGIHRLKPTVPEHLSFVHAWEVPAPVLQETTERYLKLAKMLTEKPFKRYQRENMGIAA